MTDQRPLPAAPGPDDPFERELRALLRDRAAGPVPASLRSALTDTMGRPAAARLRLSGHRRPLFTLAAAAAGLLLLGMGLNPVSMVMEATVPGATKPTPRTADGASASPDPASTADASPEVSPDPRPATPFSWNNGSVQLMADALEITVGDVSLHGPTGVGRVRPWSAPLWRDALSADWDDGRQSLALALDVRRDAARWWVSAASLGMGSLGSSQLDVSPLQGPVGEPLTGDVTLKGKLTRSKDGEQVKTDKDVIVRFRNLRLQPFLAAAARTMDDCRPVVDTVRIPWSTSPLDEGQPLADAGLVGLPAADAARRVADAGFCYLFDRRLSVDPTLGVSGIKETWCDAPPGSVTGLRYGPGGELHLIVLEQVPRGTPRRVEPVLGFGCREGEAVPTDPPSVSPRPDATPIPVAPMNAKSFVWDSGDVRLAADAVVLHVGDRAYAAASGMHGAEPPMNGVLQELDLDLDGAGGDAQVRLYFAANGSGWTLHHFEVYGSDPPQDLSSSVAGIGTPRSEPIEGDLVLTGRAVTKAGGIDVTLELRGAELQAFRGVTARTLRDCQAPRDLRPGASDQPFEPGEPLDGLGLKGAPARKAAAAMDRLGYCYRFGLQGSTGDGAGWGESWCDAPPGKVERAFYGDQGEVVFMVNRDEPRAAREQPPVGWGCLSDLPAYASPAP